MPGYLNLAASSQVDLSTAVGIGLSTMQQFGLKATDMNKIVDQMSFITVKSATGLQDLGEGLKYIGVSAASMKVPLSETLASLGVLADAGEKGSIGARSLSTSIQRLSAPTKAMDEIMSKLNLRFFDSKGQFIGINNSVELLETRMKGFTDEQRANALSVLFGNEAFSEWNILLNKGSGNLKDFTKEIENSQGTADKIAKLQLDNLSGDLESLSGAWESIQLKIFSSIEPFMRGVVQIGSSLLSKFYQSWDTLMAPLSEVKKAFGELFQAIGELFSVFSSGNEEFDLFGASMKVIAEGIKLFTVPIAMSIRMITELVNALKLLFQSFAALWTGIKTFASRIMDILLPLGEIFQGVFTLNWDKVKSGASSLTKNFKSIFNEAKDAFVLDFATSLKENSDKAKDINKKEEPANPLTATTPNILQNNIKAIAPLNSQMAKIKSNDIDVSGAKAEGKAGKSVVVTINNLVNSLSVNGTSIPDIENKIRDVITKTLVEAVKDFEVSYA